MRVHFIGVGGSGMSAVARLWAVREGVTVTGTDRRRSAYFAALEAAGMDVRVGEDPEWVAQADAVVITSAVRESNPELMRARAQGIPVLHRSQALVEAVEGRRLVAVAGSHGKTTTSAMVATALHGAGVDASYAVGARVLGIPGAVAGGYAGTATVAVVEADESDGSFLRYRPAVGIITNIEPDHLDHYGTVEALHQAFADFARLCQTLVVCADDPVALGIGQAAREAGVSVITYGAHAPNVDVAVGEDAVSRGGERWPLEVPFPGAHMRLNAAAAWAAAVAVGADPEVAARALGHYAGTGRRFELRGEVAGVRVVDDYAHHPTEVAAVVQAARESGAGHLVVLFQPALFSRTQALAAEFGAALSIADAEVILAPVHGDREDPLPGVSSELIARHVTLREGQTLTLAESLEDAATRAADAAVPGTLVLTVGSGTVTEAAGWIVEALRARDAEGGVGGE